LKSKGIISIDQPLIQNLEIANHVNALILKTNFNGNIRYQELTVSSEYRKTITLDDLSSWEESSNSGRVLHSNNGPDISIKYDKWDDDEKWYIKSSKEIDYIELNISGANTVILNADVESNYGGEVKENGKKFEWDFQDFDPYYSIGEVEGIWVYSDNYSDNFLCDSGVNCGSYISNPYYSPPSDIDNDGTPDTEDADPTDPTISYVDYQPSQGEKWTLAFEDSWPHQADYDFNDLVLYYNYAIYTNADGNVTKLTYDLDVAAIGAVSNNDFSLSFNDPSGLASLNETSSLGLTLEKLDNIDQTEIRFNNIRNVYGGNNEGIINTYLDKSRRGRKSLSGEVVLGGEVALANFVIEGFLRVDGEAGREVHLPDYPGSVRVDVSLYGTAKDDTNGSSKYYKTTNNLPWAIRVPNEWASPIEFADITVAYKNFESFATSNPSLNWYSLNEENCDLDKTISN
jgi:LruC domain-containing protein